MFTDNSQFILSFDTYVDGRKFEGFKSGAVAVSFKLTGGGVKSSVIFNSVSNQYFSIYSLEYGDMMGPDISTEVAMHNTVVSKGTDFYVPAAKALDVLSDNATVTVTVTAPGNKVIHNAVDISEGFNVKMDEYGVYFIRYEATDYLGNMRKITYNISVDDLDPPDVTVAGEIKSEYKAGDLFVVPKVTASDNVDAEPICYIVMKLPDASFVTLEAGDKFGFSYRAAYTLYIYAKDSSGNVSLLQYDITVK